MISFLGLIRRGSVASGIVLDCRMRVNALSGLDGLLRRIPTLTPELIFRIRLEITGVMAFMQLLVSGPLMRLTIRPRFTAGRSPLLSPSVVHAYNCPHQETLRHIYAA